MLQLAHPKVAPAEAGTFRPRICHSFRYPIRYECQTSELKPGKYLRLVLSVYHLNFIMCLYYFVSAIGINVFYMLLKLPLCLISFCWSFWYIVSVKKFLNLLSISLLLLLSTSLEFFTSVLADGFSLEFVWQQVSSCLQDSSQDSGRS